MPTVLTRARVQVGHVPSTCSRRAATSAAFRRWLLAPKRSSKTLALCWQASLQNARELLEAAGARERARVGGSGRRVDCPRAWLAPGSPEEGTTPRPAKEGWRWPGVISLCRKSSAGPIYRGRRHQTKEAQAVEYILVGTLLTNIFPQDIQ